LKLFSGYIIGTDKVITQKSIESIAKISFRIKSVLSYSFEIFMKLLETGIDDIISSIITVLEGRILVIITEHLLRY
jgi:hypothetical protein